MNPAGHGLHHLLQVLHFLHVLHLLYVLPTALLLLRYCDCVTASNLSCLAAQQREHGVGQGVGLRQHRRTRLLQNLAAGEVRCFNRKVRIQDPAA